ncbi:MAG TPA: amino acid adenylation domain-containing protein [Thermoanaerobaculia bacterium]|jgi:amino acid adenylation domain-containing protein/non-ribosomal peptide synthase protein (TIGR01720 family)|nr:amino acid adenylation domain-containing protein [Thermoanaerobaculia bacterium]
MAHDLRPETSKSPSQKRELLKALLLRKASEPRTARLSLEQRRLFTLNQLSPGDNAYNLLNAYQIEGPLDLPALRRALTEIVRRHEALRTVFAMRDGEALQIVRAAEEVKFGEIDLSALPAADRLARAHEIAGRATRVPFDLATGPLFRFLRLRLAADVQILLLVWHHIVIDAWSFGVFNRELAALYAAFRARRPSPLAPLSEQYADFSVWQHRQLTEEVREREMRYWEGALSELAATELPGDFPRPSVQTHHGAIHVFRLPAELLAGARKLAERRDVSPYVACLAIFQTLLHRLTGADDVSCGTPVSTREKTEAEGLIGFLVNTVVLRTDLSGRPSFSTVLDRAGKAAGGVYAHSRLPFDLLVERLKPARDTSRNPLYQITFQMGLWPALELADLLVTHRFEQDYGLARVDLEVYVKEDGETILVYNRDLYLPRTIANLARRLVGLWRAILDAPDHPVADLPLFDEAERHQVLFESNDTAVPDIAACCLHELFERRVEAAGDAIAGVYEDSAISYEGLNGKANRLAHWLRGQGVGPEVLVGIQAERSLDLLIFILAILKAGGAYLPISAHHPPERLVAILEDSGTRIVLTDATLSRIDLSAYSRHDPAPLATSDNLAYVIYTSGSTGRPKGVQVEHRSPLHLAEAMERLCYRDLAGPLRLSVNAPIEFDASMQQIVMLTRGHCLVILPEEIRLDGRAVVRYLDEHGVDGLDCTPSHLAMLLDAGLLDDSNGSLRKILCAGGPINRRMWNRLAAKSGRTDSYNIYGPTECTVNATGQAITSPDVPPGIGGPLAGYTVFLLDRDLNPVPIGGVAEIYIGGRGVTRGYFARPDRTAGSFVPAPFGGRPGERLYRTGDFARRLDDGTLEFIGRHDAQIKIRGFRIELGEIQAALLEHAAVGKAAVVVEGEGEDRFIVAYVVPAEPPSPGLGARIRADLELRVPDYMVPGRYVFLAELPLSPSGKLDRRALPAAEVCSVAAARSVIEDSLLEIWADAFGVDYATLGTDSSFFELGGHSLLATQISSRIRDALEVEVAPRLLFSHPTPGELAQVVEELRGVGAVPLPPIRHAASESPPLSFAQERIWFFDQIEPGLAAYNIPFAVRLDGALDFAALAHAFRRVVAHHAVMGTAFAVRDGRPFQQLAPAAALFVLPQADLSRLDPKDREAEVRRRAEADGARPFRLDVQPLFRAALLRLGGNESVLLVCLHHAITDAWSIRLVLSDLGRVYASFLEGLPDPLAEPAITYADYALWQRQVLHQEAMEAHERFWRKRLDGEPPILHLPLDRPRPPIFRYRGGNVFFTLPEGEIRTAAATAHDQGVSVFMFLAAAVQLLLARYSGQQDVWLGSPMANRGRSELEGVAGLFINMVVQRADLDPRQTVRDLLRQARRTILDASDHQDLPFERLVEALNPDRSLSYHPLFQCMLTFQHQRRLALELPGVAAELLAIDNGTAKLDLTFDLGYTGDRLDCRVEYNTDIFDRMTILRLVDGFRAVVGQMAARSNAPLANLSALGRTERFQLVREWNDTARAHAEDLCLHQLFERRQAEAPDRIAAICGDRFLSYGELERRANRLAHRLLGSSRAPRGMVGIALRRSEEMLVALLGVLKAGRAYVPLDASYPRDRVRHILETSRAELVLTDSSRAESLEGLGVELLRIDSATLLSEPEHAPASGVEPGDLAYVIFTSGSTGKPKGVVLQHRPVVNLIDWVNRTYAVGEQDQLLFITSLSFDLSVYDVFGTLAAGASILIAEDHALKDPEILVDLLCTRPVTFWDSAPAALFQLQPFFDALRARAAALRLVFLSGDWIPLALPSAVTQTFPRARVVGLGGATEAAIWSNSFPIDAIEPYWQSIPYGRPIQNSRYLILDSTLEPCPINVPGDLYIGGGCLSIGYLGQPEGTALQYVPDPFSEQPGAVLYATGDRARFRSDGNIVFLGRVDAQVKVRGFRIELGEIEAVLGGHEELAEAVVLAREFRPGDRRLVAYVQPMPAADRGSGADAAARQMHLQESLVARLRSKLPDYMIPGHFVFMERWPVTANGKLDRKALPAPRLVEADDQTAAESPLQAALAAIWCEILGLPRIGIHDNFFTLGGDSILAIQIVARAHQVGLRLHPRDFFQAQTVAAIVEQAEARVPETARREIEVVEAPLTPVQRWFVGRRLPNPNHFNQAVFLQWKEALDVPRFTAALGDLCALHDALRLRLFESDRGWRQTARPADSPDLVAFSRVDLAPLVGAETRTEQRETLLEEHASRIQGGLDIIGGPLVAACLFDLGAGRPQQVLLAIHHLAVDGVSWRILLDDLATLYRKGRAAVPGAGSWMRWADQFARRELVDSFHGEESFWLRQGRRRDLPRDVPTAEHAAHRAGSAETLAARLSSQETEMLLRRVPEAYRTRTVDVLLAALARALGDGDEPFELSVDLETHGRSHELSNVDPSRTAGWFTSIFPLALETEVSASDGALLKSVKEQLRAVPREGVGFGVLRYLSHEPAARLAALRAPEILFNYHGRFDQGLFDNPLFRVRTDRTGRDVGADNARTHALEITSLIVDGIFETRWRFSPDLHRTATIERWLERFTGALRKLISHCLAPDAGRFTPSDFPLARLDQRELDALLVRHPDLMDLYPATATQQGMLFHAALDPDSQVYVQQVSLDIRGRLDGEALRAAWSAAVVRQACLRTLFAFAGSRALQAVVTPRDSFWSFEDWRQVEGPEREDRLERFLRDDLRRRFVPTEEPPFRVAVVRLDDQLHRLVVTFHHALMDGWSLAILFEEVSELYQAAVQNRPSVLPPAQPLRDHAAWLAARDPGVSRTFWQTDLAGFSQANRIARPRTDRQGESARRPVRLALPPALTAELESYSRAHRLTLSTIFQAAWALLVGRYSDAEDVVLGVTTSGRDQGPPGIDRMVGLFINTLPLRIRVEDGATVGPWLEAAQRKLFEIRQLGDSSLAEIQAASDLPPGQPLFESIVVVENYPYSEALVRKWLGLDIADVRTYEKANYALSLLVELRSEVTLEASYDPRFFDAPAAQRVLSHLYNLLAEMVRKDEPTLAELHLLSRAERHQLTVEANDSASGGESPECLHELLERQATSTPDRIAVTAGNVHLGFAALAWRAARLASYLQTLGVAPGDRVGLRMERSVDAIVAIFGTMKAGAAYVPIDLDLPAERMRFMLDDSGAKWLLAAGRSADSLLAETSLEVGPAVRVVDLGVLDEAAPGATLSVRVAEAGLPAYVIYTSGSTGRPKGVAVAHRSVVNLMNGMQGLVYDRLGDGLRFALNAPFAFDASMQQIAMLCRGHSLHLVPAEVRINGPAFVSFLFDRQIEALDITPSHLGLLIEAGLLARTDLALRRVSVAGGAIDQALWDRLADSRGARFFDIYGPTEATVNATGRRIAEGGAEPSIGRPLANYRAYVLDRNLRVVPSEVAGELAIGGQGLALGYHARPDLTAARFVPDPFAGEPGDRLYLTGDRVRRRDDGELQFLGRMDFQVKVRGVRVELEEIESVLSGHGEVSRAVVALEARESAADAVLVAYYTTDHGRDLPREALRAFLRRSLPEAMVPNGFIHLAGMPLQANGKVARGELSSAGAASRRPKVPPLGITEEKLVAIWSDVLEVDPAAVGVLDDFLSLGGHSLSAVLLLSRIQREFATDLSLRSLYEGMTLREIAGRIDVEEALLLQSDDAAQLLDQLQGLSEEEIRALLSLAQAQAQA